MMKALVLIVWLLFLVGCTSDSSDPKSGAKKPGVENQGGGISSGGGDTLPDNPVSAQYLYDVIVEAKRDLRTIVKFQDELYYNSSIETVLSKKLFGGNKDLFDILESVDIEILMDKPCRDKNGKAVDGSIYSSIPNAICISPFSMAPKLIEERARVEVLALIIHELSHFLGTTEDEAVELQKDIAFHIKGIKESSTLHWVDDQAIRMSQVSYFLRKIINKFDKLSMDEIEDYLRKAMIHEAFTQHRHPEFFISLFDGREKDLNNFFANGQLKLLHWYVLSESSHQGKDEAGKRYLNVFGSKDEVKYSEYAKVHFDIDLDNNYRDVLIRKVQSKKDILHHVEELYDYFNELSEYFYKIKANQILSVVKEPFYQEIENPWSAFSGEYSVTNIACKENGLDALFKEVGFSVKMDEGHWVLRAQTSNGYGEMGLYNDAGDVWGGSTVKVFASDSKVSRTAEYGTSWNREWKIKSYTMEKLSDNSYKMIKQTTIRTRASHMELKEDSVECVYSLSLDN